MSLAPLHRPSVSRRAKAKVNLALAVAPPRDGDGMHPIASWMAPINLADDLLVTRLEDDRLSRYAILWHHDAPVPTPIDWSVTKDLAVRAHLLLEEAAGRKLPVQLKLDKRIPVGGGLGGGSADAAAMLLALRELFGLENSDAELAGLASQLGSDVPFFLEDSAAIVEGIGDRIERTATPSSAIVLIMPEFACPTPDVYRSFDACSPSALRDEQVRAMARAGSVDPNELFNDLAEPAERTQPGLRDLRKQASDQIGLPVHITGSGSTMFIVCDDDEQATDLAARLAGALADCAVRPARIG